jgi:hypothetical protein
MRLLKINLAGKFIGEVIIVIVQTKIKTVTFQKIYPCRQERGRAFPLEVEIMMNVDQTPTLFQKSRLFC